MCLLGQAKTIVDTYSNTAANYPKALEHLKNRFGRDELIINSIYRDLLSLVKSKPSLSKLHDIVHAKIRGSQTLGVTTAEILVPLIEECLPIESLKLWERRDPDGSENQINWISQGQWKTFVGNRVKEILQLTRKEQWCFVVGDKNPAWMFS